MLLRGRNREDPKEPDIGRVVESYFNFQMHTKVA